MNKTDKKIFSTLFLAIFISITGVGIVVPLLPVYARSLGASGFYIGMIFGAFSISRTLFLPWFGALSDRKGRKPWIVAGLFAYALISVGFVLAKDVNTLIIIRFVHGIASAMIMPVTQAYVGDITPKGKEGFYMGMFNMSMFASLSLGPFLGGIINEKFSLNIAFFCMGGLAIIGFFLAVLWLPSTSMEKAVAKKREKIIWRVLLKDKKIVAVSCFRLVYTSCIGIIWCFLPIYADSVFGLSSSQIGFIIMSGVFISGIIQLPMGYLADKMDKWILVIAGGLLVSCSMIFIQWANGYGELLVAVALFGIGGGIAMPSIMAVAVQRGEKNGAMGSVMALITMAHSLGMLVGSALAGITMDFFSLQDAFPMGAGIMLAGVLLFGTLTFKQKG